MPISAAPASVLVTGASSGLGAALAAAYARPGATLFLSGRDPDRLAAIAETCRAAGANVHEQRIDVTDRTSMADWIAAADRVRPLELVIANAGISAGTGGDGETPDQARAIFAVNLDGVTNTVLPALTPMRARRRGQIAIMSSLAGFRGLPGAPAYSASKAAVRLWGEGLRGWLGAEGIGVSVICPGFVATPMTAVNRFPMPFLMSAERAAGLIKTGLARDRGRIVFPLRLALAVYALAAMPDAWADRLTRTMPRKGG
jgi:short-subunit dehydrogenase